VNRSGARVRDESGQSLIVVVLLLFVLCWMAGFAIDVGRSYVAYRHLQAAVDAAALAAAQYPDPAGGYADAKDAAVEYSACTTGDPKCPGKNTYSDLGDVPAPDPVTAQCRNSDGTLCTGGTATAMHVEQSASVPLFFAKFLGFDSFTVTAKATALFKGGVPHPLDVMVVVDTTGSMDQNCGSPVSGITDRGFQATKLDCAKEGIRALLGSMWPCNQGAPCGTAVNGNVPNPVDKVGLMVFPPLCAVSGSPCSSLDLPTRKTRELDCNDNLTTSDVNYEPPNDYLIVPFSSDFRDSDTSPINGDSNLLKSVWWYQCPGHQYPGGSGPAAIGGGPSGTSDRSGARNVLIEHGPSNTLDRSGASNASTIGGGAGNSGNRSSASNASTIGGGASNSSDRTSASVGVVGSIGGGVPTSGSSSGDHSSAQNSSGNTSISIARPTNRVAGDFLLAAVSARDMLATENICAPTGWTSVRRDSSVSGTSTLVQEVFRKFSATTSSDTPNVFTFRNGPCPSGGSPVARRATAVMIRYTGVDTADPIDTDDFRAATSGTTFTAPAVTTSGDNERVVNLYGLRASTPSMSQVTFSVANGSSSNGLATGAEDFTKATPGLTNAGTATGTSGFWIGQTVALNPIFTGASSITLNRPTNRQDGDLLLVSVTARDLVGEICPPAGGAWTQLRQDRQPATGNPAVAHATFWSFRSGTSAESYTFTFSSSCASGSPVSVAATAVAVRYTGVDAPPVEISDFRLGTDAAPTAPTVTTTLDDDRVVRLWGTRATSFSSGTSFSSPGSGTATGVSDSNQVNAGPTGTATANTGSTSAPWAAHTVALKAAVTSSITIGRPSTRQDGDLLLVSVTARNLVGYICPPDDGSWTLVPPITQPETGNSVTHATFWSVRSGFDAGPYTFNFRSGSCSGGSPVSAPASAVAVRYTGVDPIAPIDDWAPGQGTDTAPTAPTVTTTLANDRVVRLWGTRATSFSSPPSANASGSGTATGVSDSNQATAGPSGTAPLSTTSAPWAAHTVALKAAVASSITISRPSNKADGDLLLVSVTARDLVGEICPPDGTWTQIGHDRQPIAGNPAVTHATFWSFRSGTSPETYTFTFKSSCASGSPVSVAASAAAVRYTGIDPTAPIDVSGSGQGTDAAPTAPTVTTTADGDRIVRLYGTRATSFTSGTTFGPSGSGTATGVFDSGTPLTPAGSTGTATASTGPTSAPWVAHTVALRAIGGSITINRPSNRDFGDFLLASVTARNLGEGHICPPSDWTLVREDTQPDPGGLITHATFWSFRSGDSVESYTFTFRSGPCPSGGSPVSVPASAVVVRYTGVDPALPIDWPPASNKGNTGTGTTLNASQVTTHFANDRVVYLYGSGCSTTMTNVTYPFSGSATSTGVEDATQATAGLTPAGVNATSCSNTNWVAHTVPLKFIGNCNPCDYGVESGSRTYYTEAIKAAQNELVTNGRPNAQHVIIFLGDGGVNETIAGDNLECHSPIIESNKAQHPTPPTLPTWVYSIAYDATGTCTDGGITYGSSSSANNSVNPSTLVISKPSTVADNDVLVAGITVNGGNNTTITPTPPLGWTLIERTNGPTNDTGTAVGMATYYHVVTDSSLEPASYTWNLSGSGTLRASGGINSYTGVDTANPIDMQHSENRSSSVGTNLSALSVTTTTPDDLVVGFYGTNASATFNNYSSGMSERYDVTIASGPATAAADDTQGSAGATGNKSATASASANWVSQLVALKPDPAGGTIDAICIMHRIANPNSDCTDNANNATNNAERFFNEPGAGDLTAIFTSIGNDLTTTRLIDDG
jgi:Flp pilus assembly protein TadG